MTREVCGCCWVPIELCEKHEVRTMTNEELIAEWESAVSAEHKAADEIEKLRADAERYRYLRNRDAAYVLKTTGPAAGCWIDCDGEDGGLCLLTGEDADAAIDALRGEK